MEFLKHLFRPDSRAQDKDRKCRLLGCVDALTLAEADGDHSDERQW